jgi:hypothetical protein
MAHLNASLQVTKSLSALGKVSTRGFDKANDAALLAIKEEKKAKAALDAVTRKRENSGEGAAGGSSGPASPILNSGEGAAGGSSAPASPTRTYPLVRCFTNRGLPGSPASLILNSGEGAAGGSSAPASPTLTYPLVRCYTNHGLPGSPAFTPPGAPVLVRPVKRPTLGNGGAGGNTGN